MPKQKKIRGISDFLAKEIKNQERCISFKYGLIWTTSCCLNYNCLHAVEVQC